ncbi:MAG: hypothetical protein ABI543_02370 [Ignavibacteria bacterium]
MKVTNKAKEKKQKDQRKEENLPGYKPYPDNEDIFSVEEETDIDPDKLIGNTGNSVSELKDELLKKDSGLPLDELDIPGAELDDEDEETGNEDEENNYYSLGGDNHNDLDEDKS